MLKVKHIKMLKIALNPLKTKEEYDNMVKDNHNNININIC